MTDADVATIEAVEPTPDQLVAEGQQAAMPTKRQRIERLEERANELLAYSQILDRRLNELEAREFHWKDVDAKGDVTVAYGPRSGRLYSIVRQFNGDYLLNWPGGTLYSKDRQNNIYMATLIERSWSPEEDQDPAGETADAEGDAA